MTLLSFVHISHRVNDSVNTGGQNDDKNRSAVNVVPNARVDLLLELLSTYIVRFLLTVVVTVPLL